MFSWRFREETVVDTHIISDISQWTILPTSGMYIFVDGKDHKCSLTWTHQKVPCITSFQTIFQLAYNEFVTKSSSVAANYLVPGIQPCSSTPFRTHSGMDGCMLSYVQIDFVKIYLYINMQFHISIICLVVVNESLKGQAAKIVLFITDNINAQGRGVVAFTSRVRQEGNLCLEISNIRTAPRVVVCFKLSLCLYYILNLKFTNWNYRDGAIRAYIIKLLYFCFMKFSVSPFNLEPHHL